MRLVLQGIVTSVSCWHGIDGRYSMYGVQEMWSCYNVNVDAEGLTNACLKCILTSI